ncbi:MAG: TolC family protein [Candidatus Manganitrophus sp. SA1]|nr:TolC family protein [Candidatus Manganitrophus morganii]
MKRLLFVFVFIFGAVGMSTGFSAAEESADALLLQEVLREVVAQNPEILAAKGRSLAAREWIPQARALDDPQFGITRWEFPANFNILKADETWYTLSQQFPFFGKRGLREKMADLERAAADEEFRAVSLRTVRLAKQAYDDLFLARKLLEIHHDQVDLARKFSQIAQEKFAVGEAGQQDLLRARMELLNLSNAVITLEQERESAAARLNILMNRPVSGLLGVPQAPTLPSSIPEMEALQGDAEETRSENRIGALAVQRGEEAIKLAERDRFPDLTAEVGFMDMHDREHNAWMATVRINIPWVNRKKYDARIRENEAEQSRAEAAYRSAVNESRFKIKDLWTRFEASKRLADLYQDGILPLAEQSLESALIGYQTGKNDFLTLIDAQRNFKEAETTYFRALADADKRLAELEEMVGREF